MITFFHKNSPLFALDFPQSGSVGVSNKVKSPLTLTPRACDRVIQLLKERFQEVRGGLRVSLDKGGCSGLVYHLDTVDLPQAGDEVVEINGNVRVFVAANAFMFLIGACIDLEVDELQQRFVFLNPNEKGRCGCGKSFFV